MNINKKDLFLDILLGAAAIGIILLGVSKFMLKTKSNSSVMVNEIEKINILGIDGKEKRFTELLKEDTDTYCMIFDLTDCATCIYKGIADLQALKKEKIPCVAIAVHDSIDDVKGYAGIHDFNPFFMMRKKDFYKYVSVLQLPVIIRFNGTDIKSFRYILP